MDACKHQKEDVKGTSHIRLLKLPEDQPSFPVCPVVLFISCGGGFRCCTTSFSSLAGYARLRWRRTMWWGSGVELNGSINMFFLFVCQSQKRWDRRPSGLVLVEPYLSGGHLSAISLQQTGQCFNSSVDQFQMAATVPDQHLKVHQRENLAWITSFLIYMHRAPSPPLWLCWNRCCWYTGNDSLWWAEKGFISEICSMSEKSPWGNVTSVHTCTTWSHRCRQARPPPALPPPLHSHQFDTLPLRLE